jgi:hypothetical protein
MRGFWPEGLRHRACLNDRLETLEASVTRTIGAAIGALIIVFFMADIATRLSSAPAPVAAASTRR